jgi:hypothetical protein
VRAGKVVERLSKRVDEVVDALRNIITRAKVTPILNSSDLAGRVPEGLPRRLRNINELEFQQAKPIDLDLEEMRQA